jgi:hypothetical protein
MKYKPEDKSEILIWVLEILSKIFCWTNLPLISKTSTLLIVNELSVEIVTKSFAGFGDTEIFEAIRFSLTERLVSDCALK